MESSYKKFQKYASHVEGDIETLLLSMLDLIDSKTETIRKLVKLHMHIKTMTSLPMIKHKLNQKHIHSLEAKSWSVITNNTNGSMNENLSGSITANKDATEINFSEPEDEYQEIDEPMKFSPTNAESIINQSEEAKIEAPIIVDQENVTEITNENVPNPQEVVNADGDNSVPTLDSYVIIANLEGALNTLEQYEPGDSGIYVDKNSYTYVVDILKSVISSYDQQSKKKVCKNAKTGKCKNVIMDKCCTLPSLKVQEETFPQRLISSTTDCNKYQCGKCCKKCSL